MAKRGGNGEQLAPLPAPTPEQVKRIEKAKKRNAERGSRLAHAAYPGTDGEMNIGANHSDQEGWIAHLADACGTSSQSFAAYLIGTLEPAMRDRGASEIKPNRANAVMAALDGIARRCAHCSQAYARVLMAHAILAGGAESPAPTLAPWPAPCAPAVGHDPAIHFFISAAGLIGDCRPQRARGGYLPGRAAATWGSRLSQAQGATTDELGGSRRLRGGSGPSL